MRVLAERDGLRFVEGLRAQRLIELTECVVVGGSSDASTMNQPLTWPNSISSPSFNIVGAVIGSPITDVPFLLFRSSSVA